ncbi:MAG: DUF922 domain-containing protein [Burkholderiaceae bacterium]|jgi:predicted secreted Zn-dependent protease
MRHLLFFFAVVLAHASAAADVEEIVSNSYYTARPAAGATLLEILNTASPVRQNGRTFHAYTSWDVRWTFRWQQGSDGRCAITAVNTKLKAEILLPKVQSAEMGVAVAFNQYLNSLRAHEEGHLQIARSAAKKIDQKIRSLPTASSCQVLEVEANREGMAILDAAKKEESAYDVYTAHGCQQGACLVR